MRLPNVSDNVPRNNTRVTGGTSRRKFVKNDVSLSWFCRVCHRGAPVRDAVRASRSVRKRSQCFCVGKSCGGATGLLEQV
eukprot:IDg9966t1